MDAEKLDDGWYRRDLLVLGERGRRAVGLWPDQDAEAEALADLLTQAANKVEDEEDAGALRAGRLMRGVPSAVVSDILTAWVRSQTGS